ncbi:haloacid dehalogenase type II [Actinoplanes subtropicus]|uniref:haloacid dehalogenase type II n=1 Tax=Actinoplanes subtropicus TaxID=543632 RepID=UPI00068F426B|nr:haloacid dehalogenase type II [Actinoplanes subtropicus]
MTSTRPARDAVSAVWAVLFDTFGTVVDWRSGITAAVRRTAAVHGVPRDAEAFADAWRAKYEPSMDRVRKGLRQFTTLTRLHRENLTATLADFGVNLPDPEIERLTHAWEQLPPWPDSVAGLTMLRRRYIVGPLSNGNVALLTRMAKHTGLPWDVIIGADVTRRYKPQPEAYLHAATLLELEPEQVMLAAAHNHDLAAARQAGFATAFVLRSTEFGPSQSGDLQAESDWDVIATDFVDLAERLGAADSSPH